MMRAERGVSVGVSEAALASVPITFMALCLAAVKLAGSKLSGDLSNPPTFEPLPNTGELVKKCVADLLHGAP